MTRSGYDSSRVLRRPSELIHPIAETGAISILRLANKPDLDCDRLVLPQMPRIGLFIIAAIVICATLAQQAQSQVTTATTNADTEQATKVPSGELGLANRAGRPLFR